MEHGGAKADGAGAGHEKRNGVLGARDAALADNGYIVGLGHLIDPMHTQERDGPDGGPGESTLIVAEHRTGGLDINGHAGDGVDDGKPVGSGLNAKAGVFGDVGLVGGEFGDEGFFRSRPAGRHHPRGHGRIVAEDHPAFPDVGARDVDLDGIHGRGVEDADNFGVFFYRGPGDIGDVACLGKVETRKYFLHHVARAGVLQANGVQHSGGRLEDPVGSVTELRLQGGSLEAHGPYLPIGKSGNARVFFAKTGAAGEQNQGCPEGDTAEVDAKMGYDILCFQGGDSSSMPVPMHRKDRVLAHCSRIVRFVSATFRRLAFFRRHDNRPRAGSSVEKVSPALLCPASPGERGAWAERLAANYLEDRGMETLVRNYRCRFGEIDLILREDRTIVFVEVRFRRDTRFGSGAESVDRDKKRRIAQSAQDYLRRNPQLRDRPCRFDIVSVSPSGQGTAIRWIPAAFDARN